MAIPERQLNTWSHQGSITQSRDTYARIKRALEASDTNYAGKSFEVFLQGSYGNDTNIYAESDIDVVIRLDDVYHFDIDALTPDEQTRYRAVLIHGTYPYANYKADVVAALVKSFGSADVKLSNNAVKIKASGSRRNADVVVATEFRRYYSSQFGPQYPPNGICFFNSSNVRVENYPKQHSVNCTTKHQATNLWFKPMVRILKNMRGKLVDDRSINKGSAPSYFLEGLLYNVPNDKFGNNNSDTFVAAMKWVLQAKRSDLVCASEHHYLVRDSSLTCWPCADCDSLINAVVKLWDGWT